MFKRVFLIVLDSFGIGELPDADTFGDKGSNTLMAVNSCGLLNLPTLKNMGLYNIDGITLNGVDIPLGAFGRFAEKSQGKDTTIGHWEICGVISPKPFPTYPNGFPKEIIDKLVKAWKVEGVLCNKPYSGTEVIKDYGKKHLQTKMPIVYTSQDSVLQIACHESVFSVQKLYEFCEIAREIMQGENKVGRVIARPFVGEKIFTRTTARKDYSVNVPYNSLLNELKNKGLSVISIGKIYDIFNGSGITEKISAKENVESEKALNEVVKKDFKGLCFANFVDFDSLYGHRNDPKGYALALNRFDEFLNDFIKNLRQEDLVMVTADHGCDPITTSTDHSREYVPLLAYGEKIKNGVNLGTGSSFADIGATIAENFGFKIKHGNSFLNKITK